MPALTVPPIHSAQQPEEGAEQELPSDAPETESPENEPADVREPETSPAEEPSASHTKPAQLTSPETGEQADLVWKTDGQPLETTPEEPADPVPEPATQDPQPEEDSHSEELAQEGLAEEQPDEGLPVFLQVLLAAAGVAVCAACGLAVAGLGPFQKRR